MISTHNLGSQRASGKANIQCCLHVGLPKTGTSLLQEHLFSQHSQIQYLGKYLGQPNRFPDTDVQKLNRFVLRTWPGWSWPSRRAMAPVLESAVQSRKVVVWSDESISSKAPEKHARFARSFRNVLGECKVIFTLRHPTDWLESMYFQRLRGYNRSDATRKYFGELLGEDRCYFSIDEFLTASWQLLARGEECHLRYAEMIAEYARVFGPESIGIFLHEQMRSDPGRFVQDLCEFVGVDAEQGVQLTQGRRSNDRWTVEQIESLQRIQQSKLLRDKFLRMSRKERWSELGLDSDQIPSGPRARAELSAPGGRAVCEFTARGNRELAEKYALPLAEYGYPL